MSDSRNLLPQALNFKPGTSLIGNFGSTDTRFKHSASALIPGPGAYHNSLIHTSFGTASKSASTLQSTWGTGAGHQLAQVSAATPGPGAYGDDQHPCGGILTGIRRKWPGIPAKSAFSSNAATGRETDRPVPGADMPGPGQYNVEDSSYFRTSAPGGARSPFLAAARQRTGSRLQRDMDAKVGAVFSSRLPSHKLPDNDSGAATDLPRDGPGPSEYAQVSNTIGARFDAQMRQLALRSDGGAFTSFQHTSSRFPEDGASAVASEMGHPGPGAHSVRRWTGEKPDPRRPRHEALHTSAGRCGFLSSSERFDLSGQNRSMPDAVVRFLASGSSGPVGQPTHAQDAMRRVAASVAPSSRAKR